MAVYTKVSDEQARDFVALYDIGALQTLTGIKQGVENSNYILQTDQARYILTLYEKRVNPDDLPFFLGLMEHVARKSVPCPLPIRARNDQALHPLAGRPAALTSFLEGGMTTRISAMQCAEVGRALAQLHVAAADYKLERPNALSLPAWHRLARQSAQQADTVKTGLRDVIAGELEFLERHWPQALPSGVIHADLFADNVFFDGEILCGLIDFYFACNDQWAYDLVITLNAWCFENHTGFNITKARAMIAGYQEKRQLNARELVALPILARGASLRFLLTRLYDWLNQVPGALVKAKDPLEYLSRLQFHQRVRGVGEYGLEA